MRGRGGLLGAVLVVAAVLSCRVTPREAPPAVDMLVEAGDSTFWIQRDTAEFRVRRSSILLAPFGGRFHELYVADDDRSFFDAVLVGERIYRRDILSGDSAVVYENSEVASLASRYAAAHPRERALTPDEDASDQPSLSVTIESDIVEVVGPYASVEETKDVERAGGGEEHVVRRFVIDLRAGHAVGLGDLIGDTAAGRIVREGRDALAVTLDSIRNSADQRARVAAPTLTGFRFDSTSFTLIVDQQHPAVAFLVPGRGEAAGLALPLSPIPIPKASWWTGVDSTIATEASERLDAWQRSRYTVLATYDTSSAAVLAIRTPSGRSWTVTTLPAPVRRIHWLDSAPRDTLMLRALAHAFDEALTYSGSSRTSMIQRPSPLIPVSTSSHSRIRDR